MTKPRGPSNVAYQWFHSHFHTKPASKGGIWMDKHAKAHPGVSHLFLWGTNTNVHSNGKTLICLNKVDCHGGDIRSQQNVTSYEQVISLIKNDN